MIASLQNNYQGMNDKVAELEERYSKLEGATTTDNASDNSSPRTNGTR